MGVPLYVMWLCSCSFFHAPFSTLYVSIIFAILITVCLGVVGFSCGSADKEAACNEGDLGSIPELGRSLGEWKGYLLQYSGLENSVDCYSPWGHKESGRPSDFNFHFGVVLFGFILFGTLCVSWNWMSIFLPRLGKFSAVISSSMFSASFSISCSFWDPYKENIRTLGAG